MIKFLDIKKITESFEPELSKAVERVVKRGWYLLGDEVDAFEKEYREFIGTKHCIGTANGLDALRLILKAYMELGLMEEGDEIIVPANTFIASMLAISDNRLKPVLVEPRLDSYNLDVSHIEEQITPRTKAIMVVHLYGQAHWPKELEAIAKKYGLLIIEDNAQAVGAMLPGSGAKLFKRTGSLGDASGHSFYPGKNLGALGDGGAVTTNNDKLAEMVRALANYGSAKKYVHDYQGLNSRLDEMQAAALRVKLPRLDMDNQRRREMVQYYLDHIIHPDITLPVIQASAVQSLNHVWHLFVIRHPRRDQLQQYLNDQGIQTLIHYPIPPHRQHAYKGWSELDLPVTEHIHSTVLSLPVSPVMSSDEIRQIVETINHYTE